MPAWEILSLVVLPVVAVSSIGFLARAFVDGGGNHWPLWILILALSGGAWFYIFTTGSP